MAGFTTLWNQFSQHTCVRGSPPPKASLLSLFLFYFSPGHIIPDVCLLYSTRAGTDLKKEHRLCPVNVARIASAVQWYSELSQCHVMSCVPKWKGQWDTHPLSCLQILLGQLKKSAPNVLISSPLTNFLRIFRYMQKNGSCACLEGGSKTNSCFHRTLSISCSKVFVQTPNGNLRRKTESNL